MNSANPVDLLKASDAELIQLCRNGNQKAYGQIVKRYQTLVCSICYNRCGDLAISEDLAQEGFILAWQKLDDLKDISKFKPWICTIVRNLTTRSSEQLGRSVTHTAAHLDSVAEISSDIQTPIERAVSAEEEKLVWGSLINVPEIYREPMILFYREAQSVTRVAEALDLSEDAVKQRLSRGRKLLRQHLVTVVESVLVESKPTKEFSGAVLLGLSGATAKSAPAAGTASATSTVIKSATVVAAKSGFSSFYLVPIMNLPVIVWLFKIAINDTRSEREKLLFCRYMFLAFCLFSLFIIALISSFWWQDYVDPYFPKEFIPAALMGLMAPWVYFSRHYGKQIEKIRIEEGTFTPPRSFVVSSNDKPITLKTYMLFCFSSLLLIMGPAIISFITHDWLVLLAVFSSAICISMIAARLSFRFPMFTFQLYGSSNGLTALTAIGVMVWRMKPWNVVLSNFILLFFLTMTSISLTLVILNTIAWKKVYGEPQSPGENMSK